MLHQCSKALVEWEWFRRMAENAPLRLTAVVATMSMRSNKKWLGRAYSQFRWLCVRTSVQDLPLILANNQRRLPPGFYTVRQRTGGHNNLVIWSCLFPSPESVATKGFDPGVTASNSHLPSVESQIRITSWTRRCRLTGSSFMLIREYWTRIRTSFLLLRLINWHICHKVRGNGFSIKVAHKIEYVCDGWPFKCNMVEWVSLV